MVELVTKVRKSGFTLAPEAGSEMLREIIGKPYSTGKLMNSVLSIVEAGWKLIKLYFMIGQPFEEEPDIDELCRLVKDIYDIGRRTHGRRFELNVSCAIFIPKPHTPFQWCGQDLEKSIYQKIDFIKNALKMPGIKLSYHGFSASRLETVLARGGTEMGRILYEAHTRGCRFDSWHEWFRFDQWREVFENAGMDLEEKATQWHDASHRMPWDFIDSGFDRQSIRESYIQAQQLSLSRNKHTTEASSPEIIRTGKPERKAPHSQKDTPPENDTRVYWGFFQCIGPYRFFSYHERTAALLRAMRRAGIPLLYSLGFNPRPKISTTTPPPLGMEILHDVMEFRLRDAMTPDDVLHRLNRELPEELKFSRVSLPAWKSLSKPIRSATYIMEIPEKTQDRVETISLEGCTFIDVDDPRIRDLLFPDLKDSPYNCAFIHDMKKLNHSRLKDIIKDLYGVEMFPFNTYCGARVSWNLDDEGTNPLI